MAETTSPPATGDAPPKSFAPSDRIAELNDIDQSISDLLASAAEAVGILSNSTQNVTPSPKTLTAAQTRFTRASSAYFSTLSAIEVRLRRQVYALEEAGLIAPGDEKDEKAGRAIGSGTLGRSGGGPLDPSWLNARADNGVDFALQRELVDQAKDFLERIKVDGEVHQSKDLETENVEMNDKS